MANSYFPIILTSIQILPLTLHIYSHFLTLHALNLHPHHSLDHSFLYKLNLSPTHILNKFLPCNLLHQNLHLLKGPPEPENYHLIYRTIITVWPPLQLLILLLPLLSILFHNIYHTSIFHPHINTSSLPSLPTKNQRLIMR